MGGGTDCSMKSSETDGDCSDSEMLAWNIVPLPANLIRALSDQGFTEPTQIQSLVLPPAILGKNNIETIFVSLKIIICAIALNISR